MLDDVFYRIYLEFHNGKYSGHRLVEEKEWDEEHYVDLMRNVSIKEILMFLTCLGSLDKLVSLEEWQEYADEYDD